MSILALAPLPVLIFVAGAAMVATGCGAGVDLGGDTARRVERVAAGGDVRLDDVRDASGGADVRNASGRADHRITARSDDGSIDIGVRH